MFVLFPFLTQHFFDNVVLNFSHFTTCTEVLTKQDFHGVSFFLLELYNLNFCHFFVPNGPPFLTRTEVLTTPELGWLEHDGVVGGAKHVGGLTSQVLMLE